MTAPAPPQVLVAVPAFGRSELTDAVLADLLEPRTASTGPHRVVVVDNLGDYVAPRPEVAVHRPGRNLRWLGAANWALAEADSAGEDVCLVLNNDTRLSAGLVDAVAAVFREHPDVAIAAPVYDDFWLHQRADEIPRTAAEFVPSPRLREVPFCDGTAIAFRVRDVVDAGGLDAARFPRHGYGADVDLALRVRERGLRCVVTESAYVHHLRRGTMDHVADASREQNRAEILTGMDAGWGTRWRALAGLGPGAFPPHNTGSAASWYAT